MDNSKRWEEFLTGDKNAFSVIFLDYYDDLYNYGVKLCHQNDIVKDSIQDLFLKLWKNRNNLNPVNTVKPYLFKSLRHHILDSLALRKNFLQIEDSFEGSVFDITFTNEDFLANSQVKEDVKFNVIKVLNGLSSRQREAIYLRYFEKLDFDTIAGVMDMNVQSVRNTIHRGLEVMRETMLVEAFFIMLWKEELLSPLFS